MRPYRIGVIGGGIGGLTAAALLAQKGYHVEVFEASREWGGCAGKFQRGSFTFPVGATLGMGFEPGGIHNKILTELGISVHTYRLDEVIQTKSSVHMYTFFRDREKHVRHLKETLPHISANIESFYKDVYKIAAEIRKLMGELPILPPRTTREWYRLIHSLSPSSLQLIPRFSATLQWLLNKHQLAEEVEFKSYIDGLVIDSMQTTSEHCSLLLGCLSLDIYHEGAFYVYGGLYKVAEALVAKIKESGGETKLSRRICQIRKGTKGWVITDQKEQHNHFDHLIYNGHLGRLSELLEEREYDLLSPAIKKRVEVNQWGTFTMYLAVDEKYIPDDFPLFMQVVNGAGKGISEGEHIFISTSMKNDTDRAPMGKRTITVSTHTELASWREPEGFNDHKSKMIEKMIAGIKEVLPEVEQAIDLLIPGSPKAWERFTLRKNGEVGGYPQTPEYSLFASVSHRSGLKDFWLCGDSVFPGAGTIGVSVSGYHVFQSITEGCPVR